MSIVVNGQRVEFKNEAELRAWCEREAVKVQATKSVIGPIVKSA